jgi:hypothetical protein
VRAAGVSNRLICYCKDCQAFARFLGDPDETLDRQGGTEIVQLAASRVVLEGGAEQLAVVRLTERGMLRWYAMCCNTPIGNTAADPRLSFIGLVHTCLQRDELESAFGPLRARVNTASAADGIALREEGLLRTILRFAAIVIPEWFSGRFRRTPFFSASGSPTAMPVVLAAAERERLKHG